jgi:hypothetical protein
MKYFLSRQKSILVSLSPFVVFFSRQLVSFAVSRRLLFHLNTSSVCTRIRAMEEGLMQKSDSAGGSRSEVDTPSAANRDLTGILPPISRSHKIMFGLPQFTASAASVTSSVFLNKLYTDHYLVNLDFLAAMSFVCLSVALAVAFVGI